MGCWRPSCTSFIGKWNFRKKFFVALAVSGASLIWILSSFCRILFYFKSSHHLFRFAFLACSTRFMLGVEPQCGHSKTRVAIYWASFSIAALGKSFSKLFLASKYFTYCNMKVWICGNLGLKTKIVPPSIHI